jgi:fermentation-respiration switch protein FrsA (DUF1100 family)
LFALGLDRAVSEAETQTITLHGHPQQLHMYGRPGDRAAIVTSGDGGWLHLGPHVAEWLGAHGWFVLGFDAKTYLTSGTDTGGMLRTQQIPRDFETLLRRVDASPGKPVLIGVSEGAGLSVVAAADPAVKPRIAGVVALGLGDVNELAWRWRDSIIYLTKGIPKEPAFHATDFISLLAPAPVALLRSARDEYVPAAESERLFALAREPKKLWTIDAADHRFSGSLAEFDSRLDEALAWIANNPGNH